MSQILTETESRVEQQFLICNTGGIATFDMPLEKCIHIGDQVVIMRRLLHGSRFALHVHQAHRQPACHGSLQRTRLLQRTNVIDQMRTRFSRLANHPRFRSIHRDKDFKTPGNGFHHRHHACELLLFADLRGSRPGRLSAHVNHGRTG
ncbi:hypothetical protein D3C81_1475900 [compost metagenome]